MALPASLLNPILFLESLVHSIVLLAWRLSFCLGFVLLMRVIIQLYLVPKEAIRGVLPSSAPAGTQKLGDLQFPAPAVTEKPVNVDRSYQVFINHRGSDVKPTLASIISHRLRDNGLRVFLNRRENRTAEDVGSNIRHAIDSASVHIAIFSKTYAESSSCLNELCLMLGTRAKLIPVFFDVKPSDLRWTDGKSVYRDAFARRENDGGHNPQKLEEWKRALEKVSNRGGLELEGQRFNSNWGKLLKTIVKDVDEVFKPRGIKKKGRIGISAKRQHQRFESILQDFVERDAFFFFGNKQFSFSFSCNIM